MANVNLQIKREEAIKRLQLLKEKGMKYTPALKCFEKGEDIGIFENQIAMKATYYQLYLNTGDGDFYDNLCKAVKDFENRFNAVVYLIQVTHSGFGTICHMFYVSDHKEEWYSDGEDLKNGYACVYAYNMDEPAFSDIGTVTFEMDPACGGLYII